MRKFDPVFSPDQCVIVEVADGGRGLTVERLKDGAEFRRHPDDVRRFDGDLKRPQQPPSEHDLIRQYISRFPQPNINDGWDEPDGPETAEPEAEDQAVPVHGRAQRVRHRNQRYFNEDFVNS